MKLLQQAKKLDSKRKPLQWRKIDNETIELSLAWVKGEISTATVTEVLQYKRGGQQAYTTLARALRAYFSDKSKNLKNL